MNTPKLSEPNYAIAQQLLAATAAVAHLNEHGSTVLSIELGGRKPIIKIDGPRGPFLQGSLRMRVTMPGGKRRHILSAAVHGCQVEWQEVYVQPGETAHA